MEKLRSILARMGLKLNEQKTRKLQASDTAFNFLGFTVRYDKDIHGRKTRYWNIMPSVKSENKIREKLREFLRHSVHFNPIQVANGLNTILLLFLNYFDIPKISYPAMSK